MSREQCIRRLRTLESDTNLAMVHFRLGHEGALEAIDTFHAETIRLRELYPDLTLADIHHLPNRKEVAR